MQEALEPSDTDAHPPPAVLACHTPPDTVRVEQGHGRVNRLLRAQSVQTQTPSLGFTNAQLLCRQVQARLSPSVQEALEPSDTDTHPPLAAASQAEVGAEVSVKKRKGGGGMWRAFVSQRVRGQAGKVDFKALSEEHRHLKSTAAGELEEVSKLGQAGTARHRESGQAAFGPRSREVTRKRATAAATASTRQRWAGSTAAPPQTLATSAQTGISQVLSLAAESQKGGQTKGKGACSHEKRELGCPHCTPPFAAALGCGGGLECTSRTCALWWRFIFAAKPLLPHL